MTMTNAQAALIAAATSIPGAEIIDVRDLAQEYKQWLDNQAADPGPVVVPKEAPQGVRHMRGQEIPNPAPGRLHYTAASPMLDCLNCGAPIQLYKLHTGPIQHQWMHVGQENYSGGLFLHCQGAGKDAVAQPRRADLERVTELRG